MKVEIPQAVQEDRARRRSLNIATTELLLHGVESGNFDYLLIGRDDTAPYSQAHKEARKMDILVKGTSKEKIRFFSGADQLGLLFIKPCCQQGKVMKFRCLCRFAEERRLYPAYEDDKICIPMPRTYTCC